MKAKITLFTLLCTLFLLAQAPPVQWQVALGGSGYDLPSTIQQTSDGGYIVSGYSNSQDGDLLGSIVYGTAAVHKLWLVKLDGTGSIVWKKCYGIGDDDYQSIGASIRETAGGGYIVTGTATTWGQFSNYLVMQLDATGNVQWTNSSLGGSAYDISSSVWQAGDNGYVISGSTSGNTAVHGGYDFYIVKLDPADATGQTVQWSKALGGTGDDYGGTIQEVAGGDYVVAGFTGSNNGDVSGNHGGTDGWLVALDATGQTIQWQKTLGGSGEDFIYSFRQNADGSYIVGGSTTSVDGDFSNATNYNGGGDAFVMKLDTNRNVVWARYFGGAGADEVNEITETSDGGYIVACVKTNSGTGMDSWTLKLDASGNIEWEKTVSGSNLDENYSAHETSDNGYVLLMSTKSIDGGFTGTHGDNDYYVVKLSDENVATEACVTWALNDGPSVTSTTGSITGLPEIITPPLTVFDYNGGQRLSLPHPGGGWGWQPGSVNTNEYIEFNASPTSGNDMLITQLSFDYNDNLAPGMDFNILYFDVAYSIDNWQNSQPLGTNIVYQGSGAQTFSTLFSAAVPNGSNFSFRIYPYSPTGSIAGTPSFAVHRNVMVCGTTSPSSGTYTGSICGNKFNDLDGDGLQDDGEPGIPDWQVSLSSTDAGGIYTTMLTDENGGYCFTNVPQGSFTLTETQQMGWEQTYPLTPASHTVNLEEGGTIEDMKFGNQLIAQPEGACLTWNLTSDQSVTNATGNINGQPENIGAGSSSPLMSVFAYNGGQQLWVGNTGWVAGTVDPSRYIEFNASPSSGNDLTVSSVSFDYSDNLATGTDFNIIAFQAYYSTDNWSTSVSLGSGTYLGSSVQNFSANTNVTVSNGGTFSLRIFPYALQNGIAMTPTFATHSNVMICGETTPAEGGASPEEACLVNYLTGIPCGGLTTGNIANDGCSMSMGFEPVMEVYGYDSVYGQSLHVSGGWQAGSFDPVRHISFNAKPVPGYDLTVTSVSFDYTDLGPVGNVIDGQVEYLVGSGSNWTTYPLGSITYPSSGVSTFSQAISQIVHDGEYFILRIYLWSTQDEEALPFYPTHRDVTICGTTVPALSVEVQDFPVASLYPNPSKGAVYVKLPKGLHEKAVLAVYDMLGKRVLETHASGEETVLDVSAFGDGIYTVVITDKAGRRHFRKLVLSK